jgi:hypothetical protein
MGVLLKWLFTFLAFWWLYRLFLDWRTAGIDRYEHPPTDPSPHFTHRNSAAPQQRPQAYEDDDDYIDYEEVK